MITTTKINSCHYVAVISCLLVTLVTCAPVKKDENAAHVKNGPTAQTISVEQALKELTNVVNAPLRTPISGLTISHHETESETDVQGKKSEKSESETKVLKPNGKSLADVQIKTKTYQDGNTPKQTISEVDIPDESVTRHFGESPANNPLAYSPRAVAEYLLATGNYQGVMAAFQRLVDSGKITSEAATLDVETVIGEYSQLVGVIQADTEETEPVYYDDLASLYQPKDQTTDEELAALYMINQRLQEEADYNDQLARTMALQDEEQMVGGFLDNLGETTPIGIDDEKFQTNSLPSEFVEGKSDPQTPDHPQTLDHATAALTQTNDLHSMMLKETKKTDDKKSTAAKKESEKKSS